MDTFSIITIRRLSKAFYGLSAMLLIAGMLLSAVTIPVAAETATDGSDLVFTTGCTGNCDVIQVTVCNRGDGDMAGPTAYQVFYSATGDPRYGGVIFRGSFGPLKSGECTTLSYDPSMTGNYLFWAHQTAGYPGKSAIWSAPCGVMCGPQDPTPTNTQPAQVTPPKLTPTETTPQVTPTRPTPPKATPTSTQPTPTSTVPSPTPTRPSPTPTEPSATPTLPSATPTRMSPTPTVPSATPTLPSPTPTKPSPTPTKPSPTPTVPSATPTQPSPTPTQPSATPTIPTPPALQLQYICGYEETFNQELYRWRVINPNDFAVDYTWEVSGSSESGSGTISANSEAIFTTSFGAKTVILKVDDIQIDTEASTGPCKSYLELTYTCLADNTVDWSATNPNDFSIDYSYLLDGTISSNGNLLPEETEILINTSNGGHTLVVSWIDNDFGPLSVSETSPADYCLEPTLTPTKATPTGPTPTKPTPTNTPPTQVTPPSSTPTSGVPSSTPKVTGSSTSTGSVPGITTQLTPVPPTLPAPGPGTAADDPGLIPVTGADLVVRAPFGNPSLVLLQSLLFNLAIALFGLGLVLQGASGYLAKR